MPQTVSFRCVNRYGNPALGYGPCKDYGSKGYPNNLIGIEASKLPPPGTAPKCPSCGRDLVADKVTIDPGPGPRLWKQIAVVTLALVVVGGIIWGIIALSGSPKMQLSVEKLTLNNVRPTDTLEISNVGGATLKVRIVPGRDAILVSPETLEVKAGATGSIDVSVEDSAAKTTRIDTTLELETNDPKFAKFPVALAWRNVNGVLDQVFGQAHENLYPKREEAR